jgi:hypothetical protein
LAANAYAAVHALSARLSITPGTKITNSVTSTTTGSNCVSGTEPGCTVTLIAAVPVVDPTAAVVPAGLVIAASGAFVLRRRRATAAG